MERDLQPLAKKMLAKLGERNAKLDIFLLAHADIKALKARFFKKQTEPNVLSFPEPVAFPHPELRKSGARVKKYLGEVYLNRDILRDESERTAPLLLHGILHLLGYDHIKKNERVKMEALEEKILALLAR